VVRVRHSFHSPLCSIAETKANCFLPSRSWGTNGFKNFNCYRDNGRKLYEVSGPEWANICSVVYYCVPQ
jgi:hypothetical protein